MVSIVDDDDAIREAIDGLLRFAGLEVAAFPSAEAFLWSRELPVTDCLVLDVRMPGLGGFGL